MSPQSGGPHDDRTGPPAHDDLAQARLDVAESRRLIEDSQHRVRTRTEPDGRLLFGTWAVAWGVGYLVLWRSARSDGVPDAVAFAVFFALLVAAVTITIVHTVRRTSGLRGPGSRAGTLWGLGWPLGFSVYPFVMGGIADAGASDDVLGLVANTLACFIVGLMYIGGGACFLENRLYVLGVWILLVGGVSTVAGMPGTYLVMSVAGGGGFLVMGVVDTVLTSRRRARASAEATGAVRQDEP
ncbi:hypothetical protein ACNHYB_12275 [Isoptericola jiangsuensis]|uniref:hypothetical protein n=1 Tax=Isoptericola jiangsuensis TaxID=548579 RepID=UPI003AAA93D9